MRKKKIKNKFSVCRVVRTLYVRERVCTCVCKDGWLCDFLSYNNNTYVVQYFVFGTKIG